MRKILVLFFALGALCSFGQVVGNICVGQSALLTAGNPSALTSPQYSLNPGGIANFQPTFVVTPTITTNYTLYTTGTYTDNTIHTTTALVTVSVLATPVVSMNLIQPSCTQSLASFSMNLSFLPPGPAPTYTIQWAGSSAGQLGPTTTTANNILPGNYTAAITADGGCTLLYQFTVNPAPAQANFSFSPSYAVFSITCSQPTQTVGVSNSNLTYTWTSPSQAPFTATDAVFTSTNVGTYTITGEHPVSHCQLTKTLSVVVNTVVPNATVNPISQNVTCTVQAATTVTLTALSPTVNILFSCFSPLYDANTGQPPPALSNNYTTAVAVGYPGTYTYVLTNMSNGCTKTGTFQVISNVGYPTFTLSSAPKNFTLGCSTKSVITISIDNAQSTTPGGGCNYGLIYPGQPFSAATQSSNTFPNINTPGTYTAIVKDMISQCLAVVELPVLNQKQGPYLDSVIVPRTILDCDNPSTILTAYGRGFYDDNIGLIYTWDKGGSTGIVQNAAVTVNTTSNTASTVVATYTMTAMDPNNQCTSTFTVQMLQNLFKPKPTIVAATPSLTCKTPTLILTNQSNSGIIGFPNTNRAVGFLWQGPSPQADLSNSTTYTAGTVGVYTLVVKDLDNGCTELGFYDLKENKEFPIVNDPPPATPIIDCGTTFTTIALNITTSTTNLTYSWSAPPNAPVGTNTASTFRAELAGTYSVIVTNTLNGCATKTITSVKNGSLTTSIDAAPDHGFAPLTVEFVNNSTSSSGTASITTNWNVSNGTTVTPSKSTSVSPTVVYNQPGTYTVTAYVTKGGCVGTATRVIVVEAPSRLEVPNIFTPNGDGINDIYWLKATGMVSIDMKIFDRWGHEVYELTTTKGQVSWDGNNQYGKECAQGVYYYVLKCTGSDGVDYDQKGTITLVR